MSTKKGGTATVEKSETKVEEKAVDNKGTQPEATQATPSAQPQPQVAAPTVTVDDSKIANACYANFCRVSSTPEELILDLGLNPQPMSQVSTTIQVSQRIILNHFTAKRMLSALSMALQRHEQAFGVVETDVRKRVQQR